QQQQQQQERDERLEKQQREQAEQQQQQQRERDERLAEQQRARDEQHQQQLCSLADEQKQLVGQLEQRLTKQHQRFLERDEKRWTAVQTKQQELMEKQQTQSEKHERDCRRIDEQLAEDREGALQRHASVEKTFSKRYDELAETLADKLAHGVSEADQQCKSRVKDAEERILAKTDAGFRQLKDDITQELGSRDLRLDRVESEMKAIGEQVTSDMHTVKRNQEAFEEEIVTDHQRLHRRLDTLEKESKSPPTATRAPAPTQAAPASPTTSVAPTLSSIPQIDGPHDTSSTTRGPVIAATVTTTTSAAHHKPMRLQTFDNKQLEWAEYLSHFHLVAKYNRWSEEEQAFQLGGSLTGMALAAYSELTSADCLHLPTVLGHLQRKFAPPGREARFRAEFKSRDRRNETPDVYAEALQRLATKAYPTGSPDRRAEEVLDRFIQGQRSDNLRQNLSLMGPPSIEAAVAAVFKYEANQRDRPARPVRQVVPVDTEDTTVQQFVELFNKLSGNRSEHPPGSCFTCGSFDHWIADCPMTPPRGQDNRRPTDRGQGRGRRQNRRGARGAPTGRPGHNQDDSAPPPTAPAAPNNNNSRQAISSPPQSGPSAPTPSSN
ncbi:MAG: hypothetical protein ABFR47_06660, partial [Verrucomicrobiota bacterium]